MPSASDAAGAPRLGLGRSWLSRPARLAAQAWAPDIDVSQQNNELVVRADLPGMKREDVCVDVTDTDITISGERKSEQETERGRSEERRVGKECRSRWS